MNQNAAREAQEIAAANAEWKQHRPTSLALGTGYGVEYSEVYGGWFSFANGVLRTNPDGTPHAFWSARDAIAALGFSLAQ